MFARLLVALLAGIAIGFERTYRGRPAGVRTHALVCVTSSLLMLVTVYESHWVRASVELIRLDPTRMAQGIMTGIGFLGAGVIMKEGPTVRGLTTSASIWITAAIGILAGIGFYFPLVVSVLITLAVLSLLRWIEVRLPSEAYYNFDVRGERSDEFTEQSLRKVLADCNFQVAHTGYRLDEKGHERRYSMVLRSIDRSSSSRLSQQLERIDSVYGFRITPISE
ncbi:MAG: MgtC/SapB family protein [bacterium]|nr:MgtC/SapB family protein [bacterium]